MEEQKEVSEAAELQEEQRSRRIAKAVLLFSAIIITAVAIYTTFVIFYDSENVELSPGDYIATRNDSVNETNLSEGESFVIEEDDEFSDGGIETKGRDFSTDVLPGDGEEGEYTGLINPLVVKEIDLSDSKKNRWFVLLAVLEVVVVYFVYRKVEKRVVRRKKN